MDERGRVGGDIGTALLRMARRFAEEPDPGAVLQALLAEAVGLVDAEDGGVALWDPEASELRAAYSLQPPTSVGELMDPEVSASGRAARERRPVVVEDYQNAIGSRTPAGRVGARAVAAVPVAHESRLLGTLSVSRYRAGPGFNADDLSVLEVLAAAAAATLVGMERAQLLGALLAADTAAHELNGLLQITVGHLSLFVESPQLPPGLRDVAEDAIVGAEEAAAVLAQLRRLTHLHVRPRGTLIPRTIDIDRSTGRPPG